MLKRINQIVTMSIISAVLTGCLEASFELAPESRLPKWIVLPKGTERSDIVVTLDYCSTFTGGKYVIKAFDKKSHRTLQKVSLATENYPSVRTRELDNPPEGFPKSYPAYNVVTIDGVTDIIERRKMEPVFYMTDDPAVWKELGVKQQ